MPVFTVVAGPNGCGKSTITRIAREAFQDTPVLDPDAVSRSLIKVSESRASVIDAGREILRRVVELLALRQSVVVETTLSGKTYLHQMQRAKQLGYTVALFYIGLDSVETAMQRVRERVLKGGHNIPEEDQLRRFPRSLNNLRTAFEIADWVVIFDNSGEYHVRLAVKDERGIVVLRHLPEWAAFVTPS